ncbi:MAG: aminomethyl-transferring glycine dehydrogenase subunit GcvPA [Candidatus Binataceae bacterium]
MRFIPHTDAEVASMLAVVGSQSLEQLISHVPEALRDRAAIALPDGLSESEVADELHSLAADNRGVNGIVSFLGAGYYRHYVPAAVRTIMSRAEFATGYTPYQAEGSQGTTQAIFEFQTLITQLTGLEVANASMYDGASAAAEAVLMAHRLQPRRTRVAISRALWPDWRETIRTYLSALEQLELVDPPFDDATGATALSRLAAFADDRLLCTVTGYPNVFGVVEPLARIADLTRRAGGVAISATAEGIALGLLKPPGDLGIDIAVGEGQSFGLGLQFGGPGLGFMATKHAYLRQMPGRLVGQTRDRDGRRAFCLTLATREQHIRRERATSNICTNHSLCALGATVYLALLGRTGLRELAERNVELAHDAATVLAARGIKPRFSGPFFNEFVATVPNLAAAISRAETRDIMAGVPLSTEYPELGDALLVSVTELNKAGEFEALADVLAEGR